MKLLFNINTLGQYKSRELVPLECEHCHKPFRRMKKDVQSALKGKSHCTGDFCTRECGRQSQLNRKENPCKQCGTPVIRRISQIVGNVFCSSHCSGLYGSQHKTKGSNRSRLEKWIQSRLEILYPKLEISYNDKEIIHAELDIYIPTLKIAIELNGIFHYEDVFGQLEKVQNNDKRKIAACAEKGIGLCVIDNSSMKYFKPERAQQFLQIIVNIINQKMAATVDIPSTLAINDTLISSEEPLNSVK